MRIAFEEACPDVAVNRLVTGVNLLELLKTEEQFSRPTLIVMDIHLPAIDGFDLLRQLKTEEHTCNIPVVVYSASIRPTDREKCFHLGAERFCRKGDSFEEIVSAVKEICELVTAKAA